MGRWAGSLKRVASWRKYLLLAISDYTLGQISEVESRLGDGFGDGGCVFRQYYSVASSAPFSSAPRSFSDASSCLYWICSRLLSDLRPPLRLAATLLFRQHSFFVCSVRFSLQQGSREDSINFSFRWTWMWASRSTL